MYTATIETIELWFGDFSSNSELIYDLCGDSQRAYFIAQEAKRWYDHSRPGNLACCKAMASLLRLQISTMLRTTGPTTTGMNPMKGTL